MPKQLAVYDTVTQRLEGIDPVQATGIALPTVTMVGGLPAQGQVVGQMILDQSSNIVYVWDGTQWNSVISDFMHVYQDEATLLATTIPQGHLAIAQDTGNFFIMTTGGFRQWGVREYPTRADLMADAPPIGSLGISLDDHVFWMYVKNKGGGAPIWTPLLIVPYATDAGLLADATAVDGTFAYAEDTGLVYMRSGGVWHRINSPTVTVAATAPTTPAAGDIFFDTGANEAQMWDGAAWHPMGGGRVHVSNTTNGPANPQEGDLWYDTTHGTLVTRVGNAWKNPQFVAAAASFPSRPGDIWHNTTEDRLNVSVGSRWVTLAERKDVPVITLLEGQNVNQAAVNITPQASKYVEIEGAIYVNGSASSRLELIAQKAGTWINWANGASNNNDFRQVIQTTGNGAPQVVNLSQWDTAGADLGDVPWWNSRLLNVRLKIIAATSKTVIKWHLMGQDGNGNIRTCDGIVVMPSLLFPITSVGLKTANAGQSNYYLIVHSQ